METKFAEYKICKEDVCVCIFRNFIILIVNKNTDEERPKHVRTYVANVSVICNSSSPIYIT